VEVSLPAHPNQHGFFPATRANALKRLDAFLPHAGRRYAETRNTDYGPDGESGTSRLSPYLSRRMLLEEEVTRAANKRHGGSGSDKFVSEVFWRTYFKGWLERRPHVWAYYLDEVGRAYEGLTSERRRMYERAVSGETGIACFDDWAKELVTVGYLHNHTRMWFSSIWIFTLGLPWALGADFFYRHLLDGDAASNTLSWRWTAGLHTKGKAYAARASNIRKHTDDRYDPEGLNEDPVPLEDDWNGEAEPVPSVEPPKDGARTFFLLHDDDLHPESLTPDRFDLLGMGGLSAVDRRSPLPVAEPVQRFAAEALDDALTRGERHLGMPGETLTRDELLDRAAASGAEQIAAFYPPQGPVRDALDGLKSEALQRGVPIRFILRDHDRRSWAYCDRGFFKLRKQIPKLIA
jgi:deoxyribodipyrimidine photo-lyase